MAQDTILMWDLKEAPPVKKSVDWFWAVGIIVVSLAVISIVFGNQLFGVFLLVVLFAVIVVLHKKPQVVRYGIGKDGIYEGDVLYLYTNIKSFYVDETNYPTPTLLLEVKRWFLPIMSIPLPKEIAPQDVRMYMRPFCMEKEIKEPVFHHLFEIFGI